MRRRALSIALVLAGLFGGTLAHAELVQQGNLRLAFNGRFEPHALPRNQAAPVSVNLSGSIATVNGGRPPRLRRISIAINRHGEISTAGLPTCDPAELEATTTQTALSRCRSALIGHGRFGANVAFPTQASLPVEGKMLAFNSVIHGKHVILMHIYGSNPVQATIVLTFHISHRKRGTFGTVFTTQIPTIASELGYVTDLNLTFGRRYRYKGHPQSFLSASCSAPPGFPGGLFNLAQGSFSFANGQTLTTTLSRDCLVR